MTDDDIPSRMLRVEEAAATLRAEVGGLSRAVSGMAPLATQVAVIAAALIDVQSDIAALRASFERRDLATAEDRRSLRTATIALVGVCITAVAGLIGVWLTVRAGA